MAEIKRTGLEPHPEIIGRPVRLSEMPEPKKPEIEGVESTAKKVIKVVGRRRRPVRKD